MITWVTEKFRYRQLARSVEPTSVVTVRDERWWTAIWILGCVLTFGLLALGLPLREFLGELAITVATRQGYPRGWWSVHEETIFHEARHTTQCTWFGWILFPIVWINRCLRAWLGFPFFLLTYYFLPLPIYFAAGRFYLELDADRRAWRECLARGTMTDSEVLEKAERRAKQLSSGIYFWAWPERLARVEYVDAAFEVIYEARNRSTSLTS